MAEMVGVWTEEQNDAIVADYFAMLAEDIAGRPYSKAEHNRLLQAVTGRARGSIEYKHQNCQRRRKTRPLGGAKPGQYSRHAGKRREGVARAVLACVRGDFRRTVQADWPDFRALL